jgi:hypothetical protein
MAAAPALIDMVTKKKDNDSSSDAKPDGEKKSGGFLGKIGGFAKGLFGGGKDDEDKPALSSDKSEIARSDSSPKKPLLSEETVERIVSKVIEAVGKRESEFKTPESSLSTALAKNPYLQKAPEALTNLAQTASDALTSKDSLNNVVKQIGGHLPPLGNIQI